ncbi:MAG: carbonic anhydrase [Acidimicrobiia bacterium]
MSLEFVFRNNQNWVKEKIDLDPQYFEKLSKGQTPEILYIGCSDSRVTAEEIMGLEPGQAFIHRNIANQVISTDNNVNAVVQFAVESLKVKHIVICGHTGCGGIDAAMHPQDMGQLNSWLQTLRDVYRLHKELLDDIKDDTQKFDKLVELNVKEQCLNILKIDHVQKAIKKSSYPKIHGWVFDIRSGHLNDLEIEKNAEFKEIEDIYHLV